MKKFSTFPVCALLGFGFLFFATSFFSNANAQSFSQNNINFNGKGSLNNGTSLSFGPDGRLYVTEYTGSIKIFTIERVGEGAYNVLQMEELKGIQSIQGHNDDGSLYSSTMRETIGIAVTGTAANPVIYVSSSDFRIGGGGGGGSGDVGLDTNSGVITRYSWNGQSWDEVDIVRGLPRSEENHATNGMEFTIINGLEYLIVAQGGHTNAGGPSTNFAYTTEYALSAAVLSVNLTMLNSMPILEDSGRKYIYDLPTLDDPTRPNVNGIIDPDAAGYDGIDVNDPWGGNDGLNQAVIVPGGPVQIFSPGYRNAYDLVVTEKGALYVTDNGSNGGWGGFPVNEGGGNANNNYDPNEPGSSTTTADGEKVNNKDHLTMITQDIQNYILGSFYGGHPTPVRANPLGAGLYTNPSVTGTEGAVFRTLVFHPNKNTDGFTSNPDIGLPANWPPVSVANPDEGDWRGPGMSNPDGAADVVVTTWGTNTNGIAEYTASNFDGAMKGDLIAGVNTGELRRVELNEDGSLKNLTASFASGLGGNALGVTCNGDNEIFPGTIWVATLEGKIIIMEPQDFGTCLQPGDVGYEPEADYDFDGYTNQDELENGTDYCNGGSQPGDFDKAAGTPLTSDLNDLDDDADGIPDAEDPFQLGDPLDQGSDAFKMPVINELFSSNPELKGYMGLGMTGLMNNGAPNPNWKKWLDRRDDPNESNPNDILGGAIGAMTMQMTSGTAYGTVNNQEKGFQYGVQVDNSTGIFTVAGALYNFNAPLQLYGNTAAPDGELGIFIGDGTQSNYIKFVLTQAGLLVQQEINDIPQSPLQFDVLEANRPKGGVVFYFVIDPINGEISLEYNFDNGTREVLGTITASGKILEAIQQVEKDLAVGFSGSSNSAGVEVEGTWDFLNVTADAPAIVQDLPDLLKAIGAADENIDINDYFYDNKGIENLTYTIEGNTNTSVGVAINLNMLTLNFPLAPAVSDITIRATDSDLNFIEQTFNVTVQEASAVLYRVNAGGVAITSMDDEMDWEEDTETNKSLYLSEAGSNKVYSGTITSFSAEVDILTTPTSIFNKERYDGIAGAPNLTYSFPVPQSGFYEVRLYMGNGYSGTSEPGQRIFDVSIEGVIYPELDDLDLSATFGHSVGGMIQKTVEVTDGVLNISFIHGVENPLINGIEILGASGEHTPIKVAKIPDQINFIGEELDGSLAVVATGGDGNLNYSISGQPIGITIEPTNGQIGGTVDLEADLNSPYNVVINVDDSDDQSTDAVSTGFTWTITGDAPVVVQDLPDLHKMVGAADENIDLNEYFSDNKGIENLTYSIEGNTNTSVGAVINLNVLTLSYPSTAAVSDITIRTTDSDLNFVEQTFNVAVQEVSAVLYRVSAGGPAISSIDDEMDWEEDSPTSKSLYLSEAGSNKTYSGTITSFSSEVNLLTTPTSIFSKERFDDIAGAPNLTYSFPVPQSGFYEIRLYMGNGWSGTSEPGQRIFDVSIEDVIYPELDDLDLSATFGHSVGGMIQKTVEVTDGVLNISFIHGAAQNPLINGIEILNSENNSSTIQIVQLADLENINGDVLDGNLTVSATGGDGTLNYSMTGGPAGVSIDPVSGVIRGTIATDAHLLSPYGVIVTVDDSDEDPSDVATMQFQWRILSEIAISWVDKNENENYTGRHECSFVQAGDKFFLMGGRESSQTVDVYDYTTNTWTSLLNSAPLEFNHFQATEYQGLIWIIGAFKTNNFPSELPAEHIWIFDPATKEWMQGPAIPINRQRGSAGLTVYNDKFYITGGNTIGHDGGYVAWFDEFDPATGIWTALADAPRPRDHFHSAVIGNKLYLAGGRLTGGTGGTFKPVIPEVDVYDFTTATWSTLAANLPTPRAAASVVTFKDKLLVIGGEVENEIVYGVSVNDALKITEEYDPRTGTWKRLGDLINKRHGTQAIVSGEGIFTLAGSPKKGGGNQKNMEFLGQDAPTGVPGVASSLTVPEFVSVDMHNAAEFNMDINNGNMGVIIKSMELEGTNADKFQITSGLLNTVLLKPETTSKVTVAYLGEVAGETANLIINYGVAGKTSITLTSVNSSIQVTQMENQENLNGDVLDGSLVVMASGGDGELTYAMTGAPAEVNIDPVTGVISGSIGVEADIDSPYTVEVTVDDSDAETADAVIMTFSWIITDGTPVVAEKMPDLERYINASSEDIVLSSFFNDNDGVENLSFTVENNTNTAVAAIVIGDILTLSYPASPATTDITVRATDAGGKFVEQTFNVNVIYDPAGTPIEVTAIAAQENVVEDVLDGTLKAEGTGGDGVLVYTMSGAPAGVIIDAVTGVISGTIAADADLTSPYNVVVTVDDSDAETADAVTVSFTWTILSGAPVITAALPDLERIISSADDNIDLNLYFSDNDGVENITYTVENNTDPAVGALVTTNILTLSYPARSATTDITVRATDAGGKFVEQTFNVNVIYDPAGTPIEVTAIAAQENVVEDVLDGTLKAEGTGGDGVLVYTMSGAPAGVIIDAVTGVISGTIAADADLTSPYNVVVTVDDSDAETADAVTVSFTWTILSGAPVITAALPDLERIISSADDNIDLNLYFSDNDGVENITYTVENNTDPAVGALVTTNILTLSYPARSATTDITVRATDAGGKFVEQTFNVNVIYDPAGTPIEVTAIAAQENVVEDVLDGTLKAEGTGGDGVLVYTMSGAPAGVIIDAVTGVISGTIAADADLTSPYNVLISVDDSDAETADAVTTSFTWTILSGAPVITAALPDLERYVGAATDIIDLNNHFDDNAGVEALVYSISENTNSAIGATVSGNNLSITYPMVPASSNLTIRATDAGGRFVEQSFAINVIEIPLVLHRINAGGPGILSIDAEKDWGADTAAENSTYLKEAGTNTVAGYSMTGYSSGVDLTTTPTGIFNSERTDEAAGVPNMTYSLPLPKPGIYEVRLYFANGHQGNSRPGRQIFDVELEGVIYPEFNDLDVTALFGHQTGGVISRELNISDGAIDISFFHGPKKNPMINGIEIINLGAISNPIQLAQVNDQTNAAGDVLDGSLSAMASGGDGGLTYSMTGAPAGVSINSSTGQFSGTIDLNADLDSPYSVVISVNDSDGTNDDIVQTAFSWAVTSGAPVVVMDIPDLQRFVNTADEILILSDYFSDNEGVENLSFTVASNTNTLVGTFISGNMLTLTFPSVPAVADITTRATDSDGKYVDQTFQVTVVEEATGSDIQVTLVSDQSHYEGEELDGSLTVLASGGDGAFNYSITGAPSGISIDPVSGVISGIINAGEAVQSPYEVTVNVDDSDEVSDDAVSTLFIWTVMEGVPVIVQELPDLERFTGDPNDDIDLSVYFDDNGGVENLSFSVSSNTDPAIGATISSNILTLTYPATPGISEITISATDQVLHSVSQTFIVSVSDSPSTVSPVRYRVNAGGPAIAAIDGGILWEADTGTETSQYLTEAGTNTISGYLMSSYTSSVDLTTTPTGIFSSERSDTGAGAPNMTYSFPVSESGNYEIRLYFGSGHQGNARAGRQIFDVEIEGVIPPQLNDVDLAALFGHQVGGVITETLQVMDGAIDIVFLHGPKKNPMINGIEILKKPELIQAQYLGETLYNKASEDFKLNETALGASLYPNPATYEVYLQISDSSIEVEEIQIYNFDGRLFQVFRAREVKETEGLYRLDISNLPDGTYIVRLSPNPYDVAPLRLIVKK